jgi:Fe-S oxidoreductase
LPYFAREPFHRWFWKRQNQEPRTENQVVALGSRFSVLGSRPVVLFPDTFTNYNEPEIGRAAVQLLEAAGYEVILPRRPLCCGRPLISKGLLDQALALAHQQMEWLAPYAAAGLPIVGLEPSCLLTFRDEYPDLLDDPRAADLARQSLLIDEFLAREIAAGRSSLHLSDDRPQTIDDRTATRRPSSIVHRQYLLHGHCHQKALAGTSAALDLLRRIPGAVAREVDSGCCGMAGSFGYEAEHYALSQKIGERALFPAVRALPPGAEIVAMGTSCRRQIADATGERARHLVEVLAEAIM